MRRTTLSSRIGVTTAGGAYDDPVMKRHHIAALASLLVSVGATGGLLVGAAPAQADPSTDQFVNDLSSIGLAGLDPGTAASLGQQVCPMLAQPGQDVADVAAKVADEVGRPLGPATMFTGLAIRSSARVRSPRWLTASRRSCCPASRR